MTKEELFEELQVLDKQIKQTRKNMETIDQQIVELSNVKESIDEFSAMEKGTELRIPIANGIFVAAKLLEAGSLLVNVGANVLVKKKPEKVIEMLESQEKELEDVKATLMSQFQKLMKRAKEIHAKIE